MSALILQSEHDQLNLFSASSEAELYHPVSPRHGFFSLLWKEGQAKRQRSYPLAEMAQVLNLVDYSRDTWISQAEFVVPNRRVVNLARVGLLFVDLDTYKSDLMKHRSTDEQIQTLHFWCADNGIPLPSLVVFSGRGLQAKWLLSQALPRSALPRWNACQKALVEALEPLGADRQARDASRVLRLVESVHSVSGQRVHVVDVQGSASMPQAYDFELMAEQLLPFSREELQILREQRASEKEARKAKLKLAVENPKAAIFKGYNGRALAWARLEDLRTLGKIRGGWIDDETSMRTTSLHWQLNFLCLAGAVHHSTFHHEASELAKQLDPKWKFAADELSTLRAKAQAYANGQAVDFGGRKWPALYTPKNQTLIDIFGITEDEQRQLRTIITPALATERDTLRQREKRRAAGVQERSEYLSGFQDRYVVIREMKDQGVAVAEIARRVGVTRATVYAALKKA
uniref:helix-turn-helix domain-containing protein n=1 Tax=Pseudomonas sp. TaxID=306 RepID=UPI0010B39401|nr:helix-turn-helix domain-containing protein [Pseudomonas sp.]QBM91810.1 replication protein [Pseudomonas sp.]